MAEKDFGVKRINLIGASGTPTITSPNNLNINAVTVAISTDISIGGQVSSNLKIGDAYSVGIGTTNPQQKLWVEGNGYFSGVVTATQFVGQLDAQSSQAQSVGFATTAINLEGGSQGSLPYQNSSGITSFLDGGGNNQVLLYDTDTNKPKWGSAGDAQGSFPGIDVKDEDNSQVSGIKILNIRGDNISAVSDTVSGISTITVASNLVGAALSISGISTFGGSNGVVIKLDGSNGIVTSANPGFSTVTYYGDGSKLTGIGTADSATNVALTTDTSSTTTNIVFSQTPNQNPTSSLKTNPGLIFNASTSSLGIGTTNPVTNLEVSGNSPILRISGNSGSTTRLDLSSTGAIKWSLVGNPSGSNGALTIQSNDNELIRVSNNTGNVGLGTTNPQQKLWVEGNGYFSGVVTATQFVGQLDAQSGQAQSVGFATTSTNLAGGALGSIPYQSSSGITTFLDGATVNNKVLLYNLVTNKPYWGDASSAEGSFGGITVIDESTNTFSDIVTLNILGNNISATDGGAGIASIRVNDNLVGTSLSISGVGTFGTGLDVLNSLSITSLQSGDNLFEIYNAAQNVVVAVTTTGNLGIGTTNPLAKLQVSTASSTGNVTAWGPGQLVISPGGSPTSQGLGFSVDTTGGSASLMSLSPSLTWNPMFYRASSHIFMGNTGSNELGRFDTSGNFGIGNANPTSKLDVTGNATVSVGNTGVVINGIAGIITSSNPGVTTVTYYGDGSKLTGIQAAAATNVVLTEDTSNTTTSLVFSPAPEQNPTSSLKSNPKLIFNASTSSLGIGTENPTSKLWVGGDGYFIGSVTSAQGFYVDGQVVGSGGVSGGPLVGTALSVSGISTFTNGPVFIGSGTSTGTSSQRLQVTGGAYVSGNLGIGTTNPQAKLHVVGVSTFSGDATFINDTGIKFGGIGNTSIAIKYNSITNSLDFVVVS